MRIKSALLTMATLVILGTSSLLADDYSQFRNSWEWQFIASTSDHQVAGASRATLGVSQLATDGWDGEPLFGTATFPTVCIASFHGQDVNWSGEPGFYSADIRMPLLAGQTKKWMLYLWATPDVPASSDVIEVVMRNPMMAWPPEEYGFHFQLSLKAKPGPIADGPAVGTVWSMNDFTTGFILPMYRTNDGLNGYQFEFTATAVPEPSSFVALASLMTGFAAVVRRRRS